MVGMPTRKPANARVLSANQVVAHNLARARNLRGWTQEEAAVRLEKFLGQRWSKASWSAAERSVDGVRPREFSAEEIVAFSHTFQLPLGWWFLPPGDSIPDVSRAAQARFIEAQIGYDGGQEATEERLSDLLAWLGIPGTEPQRAWTRICERATEQVGARELSRVEGLLRDLLEVVGSVEGEFRNGQEDN